MLCLSVLIHITTDLWDDGGRDHVPEPAHCWVHVFHIDNLLLLRKGDG